MVRVSRWRRTTPTRARRKIGGSSFWCGEGDELFCHVSLDVAGGRRLDRPRDGLDRHGAAWYRPFHADDANCGGNPGPRNCAVSVARLARAIWLLARSRARHAVGIL